MNSMLKSNLAYPKRITITKIMQKREKKSAEKEKKSAEKEKNSAEKGKKSAEKEKNSAEKENNRQKRKRIVQFPSTIRLFSEKYTSPSVEYSHFLYSFFIFSIFRDLFFQRLKSKRKVLAKTATPTEYREYCRI